MQSAPPRSIRAARLRARYVAVGVLILAVLVLIVPVRQHLRAASMLLDLESSASPGWLAKLGSHAVTVESGQIPTAGSLAVAAHPANRNLEGVPTSVSSPAAIEARFYRPVGVQYPPSVLVLHGVHHLGINEPRLVAFSRALAARGFLVITPELQDLADYRVTVDSIRTIGECARWARQASGRPVSILGLSFAGGLALKAAANPEWRNDIAVVAAVGAHDSLERVLEYFATNRIELPSGKTSELPAHEYGPLVAVYDYPAEFFSRSDVPTARQTLRSLLWENVPEARAEAARLSPAGRQRMELLFDHRTATLAPVLLAGIRKYRDELAAVSPHGSLGGLRGPVYLLHGESDNIIPASETLWLERELPQPPQRTGARWGPQPGCPRQVLISPVLGHLDMNRTPSLWDKLKLVHFMSGLLRDIADAGPPARSGALGYHVPGSQIRPRLEHANEPESVGDRRGTGALILFRRPFLEAC